nr:MAG TPA: hypothetical protein [Caudoviricetes sp.]
MALVIHSILISPCIHQRLYCQSFIIEIRLNTYMLIMILIR